MATKCVKLKIIKPIDMEWKVFGDILRKSQRETRAVMNKTIQVYWEWDGFKSYYKKNYDLYPKDKDITGTSEQNLSYRIITNDMDLIQNSANISQAIQLANKRWKTDKKDVFVGEKSIANYKRDVPIAISKTSVKLHKDKSNYYAILSLLNNNSKKEYGLKTGQIMVALKVGDRYAKAIVDRCLSGEYTISGSLVKMVKSKKGKSEWFLFLSYSHTQIKADVDEERILGVDMGIKYPVYMAVNNTYERKSIGGGEIESFRLQVEARRRKLLNQAKYCGNGRIGHGIKTRIKPIEKIGAKISNFRDTVNHRYSKYVVDFALKNKCGTIQMEDLKGIVKDGKKDKFLQNWSYFDLQSKITNKAEAVGIKVTKVKPRYTSQRCNKCGYIDKENRKSQASFRCLKCGLETNADYNAAMNIATKDIDDIITDYLKKHDMLKDDVID